MLQIEIEQIQLLSIEEPWYTLWRKGDPQVANLAVHRFLHVSSSTGF
jgi:hypothetical protein